jgi:phage-related protein (TIGR01555 family)
MGDKLTAKQQRFYEIQDAWGNVMAGLDKYADKTKYSEIAYKNLLTDRVLTNAWYGEGMSRKIITVVADDMTRAGFTISGDEENVILDELRDLNLYALLNEAMYWARLYAGSIIVADFEGDSSDLEEPLPDNPGKVVKLRLYDRTQVRIETQYLYGDESPNAGEPEKFVITPVLGGVSGEGMNSAQFTVHESRCAWFKGEPLPKNATASNDINRYFWGSSALQAIIDDVAALGTTNQSLANVMLEMVIGKLKLGNLGEILAENNSKALYDRMEVINVQKSVINMLLLGSDEEFSRDQVSLTNVPEVVDRMYIRVSASSNIPMTKLTGQQQSGLSNNDNASLQNYYTDIEAKQRRDMYHPLTRIVSWVNSDVKILPADKPIVIEFNPVWEPPASEKVKLMSDWMNAMEKAITLGIVTAEEVRQSTFGSGRTVFNITLMDEADLPEAPVNSNKQQPNGEQDGE